MKRSSCAAAAGAAAVALYLLITPSSDAGVGSGGGARQRGSMRLVDGLGSMTAGSASGDGIAFTTGLVAVVTAPVPVILTSFTARASDGSVLLEWSLSDDSDPIGFHVYRGASVDGPFTRLTGTALPAAMRSFLDEAAPGGPAWYRLSALERDGTEVHLGVLAAETGAPPARLRFFSNAPNPAAPSTVFRLDLPRAGSVRLTVFDASGRRRAVVFDGRLDAGGHAIPWSGDGETGRLSAGVYFYRFEALGSMEKGKVVLVR